MHGEARLALWMVMGLTLALAGGCASIDRHTFESRELRPASVAVIDTIDRETLWQMDIPPEHELTLTFNRDGEVNLFKVDGQPATEMRWSLRALDSAAVAMADASPYRHGDSERVELPGRPVRIEVDYHAPVRREVPAADPADETDEFDIEPVEPAIERGESDAPGADGEGAATSDDAGPAADDASNDPM